MMQRCAPEIPVKGSQPVRVTAGARQRQRMNADPGSKAGALVQSKASISCHPDPPVPVLPVLTGSSQSQINQSSEPDARLLRFTSVCRVSVDRCAAGRRGAWCALVAWSPAAWCAPSHQDPVSGHPDLPARSGPARPPTWRVRPRTGSVGVLPPPGPAVRLGCAPAAGAEETGGWFPCAARRLSSGGEIEAGRCTLECSRGVRRARGCSCSCSCAPAGSRTKLVASRVTSSSRAIRGRGQAGGPRHRQQRWQCLAVRPVRRARIAYVGDWPDVPGHARVAAACGDTCWWWCRGAGEVGHAKSCATWLVGWGRWDAERACFRKALCLEIRTVLHLGLCCWATACLDVCGACLTSTVAVSALR
ncbi:hypothetical protein PAHAL_3G280900 [Panicum hallii]|jgi:hypothetical protein|uniref:Uncharacterized protein n=1 Tax=Panicum hallii TaxID=206008 RepID=A0A2T8KJM5_9POAL|nr:hypothetical protein PAHAL_3G280900 [Panicum hallii]